MAEILKGAPVASQLTEALAAEVRELKNRGIAPCLAIIRVGEKPGDLAYERGALGRAAKVGVEVRQIVLPEDAGRAQILEEIKKVNNDPAIHGCLLFRPLGDRETEAEASRLLDPAKDADAMTPASLMRVFMNSGDGYPPCTAQACIEILKHYGVELRGANAAVIGRSQVIGKPVSMLLQAADATVTMCHTKTVNMAEICRNADIIIAACGKAGTVNADFVRPGQIIIDVGINTDPEGKLCGDVDFAAVEPIVKGITPVPGGVGSVTSTVLMSHVVEAAKAQAAK